MDQTFPSKGTTLSSSAATESFIEDPKVIDRIIRHLKLTFEAERPPPPQAQPQLAMAAEERAQYL